MNIERRKLRGFSIDFFGGATVKYIEECFFGWDAKQKHIFCRVLCVCVQYLSRFFTQLTSVIGQSGSNNNNNNKKTI